MKFRSLYGRVWAFWWRSAGRRCIPILRTRIRLRSVDYNKVQLAEERRHTLWRALSQEAAK